ncbi:hypothetical protein G6F46_004903 [Rhizopus delemar]|uniref:Dolichyldiphosphatase n=2 Tax=Rhizopus TaxID=4842 RepID=A0A9P7CPX2_9FUNG|nr:hypothetical protein G6F55_010474 [Rhizopus delemar]KAG1552257.1 hypothetical protein G6F51_001346 [Rhizopus arrhizus]KAG1496661.1 hypothetical protein G6F54_006313 [Rhizopus delemar]KAG1501969.1 hypothetical protein G6F53_010964 [Rhizopus delemar]KAG1511129.1 hypothetical protein G6F52_010730 [Rhizopus delemar]
MTACQVHEGLALASISLTHVYFNPQDKVSYAFAYITLAPIAILVFYASVIVSRREMSGILMLLGQLLNEVVNYILKEAIEQERPYTHLGDGYGMPSSHSQFICVYLGYHTLHQVIAGSLVGIIDTIVNLSIAKMIYLKDMRMIDNVAKWEYQQWEKARNQTKSNNKKAI